MNQEGHYSFTDLLSVYLKTIDQIVLENVKLQVLKFEFLKFRILEINNFQLKNHCLSSVPRINITVVNQ